MNRKVELIKDIAIFTNEIGGTIATLGLSIWAIYSFSSTYIVQIIRFYF